MFINNKTVALGALIIPASLCAQQQERPNILIIQCDHLSQRVIDRYGETIGLTPVIDSLANTGVVFQDAYVACPLSQPSRAGLWSGTLPHINGVRSNSAEPINALVSEDIPTLGELFTAAGYDAVHFGKTHDMGSLRGFDHTAVVAETFDDLNYPVNQDSFRDVVTTRNVVNYLSNKKASDAPFICIADMINPHNICGYVGAFQGEYIDESSVPAIYGDLPELPANFEIEDWEALPLPLQYLCCTHSRLTQAAHWSPLQYRHYVAAFRYYCKMVCAQLEEIMAALHSTSAGENTIIVLTADHGDGMASHHMVSKHASFYEEMTNVPFIISGANIKSQKENVGGLASVTLDLLPTLCGLAGIDTPADKTGVDWSPLLTGRGKVKSPDYVVSQWHTEYEYAITPGRMIRTRDYKYVHYLEGDGEQLFDLRRDKGEMHNLAKDPKYSKVLAKHRKLLKDHVEASADDYFTLKVEVDPRCRAHEVGYHNHVGEDNARSYSRERER